MKISRLHTIGAFPFSISKLTPNLNLKVGKTGKNTCLSMPVLFFPFKVLSVDSIEYTYFTISYEHSLKVYSKEP